MNQQSSQVEGVESLDSDQQLESLRAQQRVLMKILDKGGVTVVMVENKLVTTYSRGTST